MEAIPSASLRLTDVPSPEAEWAKIAEFALTFHGYECARGSEKLSILANSTRSTYKKSREHELPKLTLDEVRAYLFFENRRHVHYGSPPDGQDLLYIRALVKGIRDRLQDSG